MNFGITFRNNYNGIKTVDGLDYSTMRQTAEEIFTRAQRSSVLTSEDLSKFNRVDNGLDLYSGKINAEVVKSLSLQNAGQNVQLNKEVLGKIQYLNAQAAKIAAQSYLKNSDGKIPVNPNDTVSNAEREHAPLPNTTELFNIANLAKDRESSGGNPFSANSNKHNSHENN